MVYGVDREGVKEQSKIGTCWSPEGGGRLEPPPTLGLGCGVAKDTRKHEMCRYHRNQGEKGPVPIEDDARGPSPPLESSPVRPRSGKKVKGGQTDLRALAARLVDLVKWGWNSKSRTGREEGKGPPVEESLDRGERI